MNTRKTRNATASTISLMLLGLLAYVPGARSEDLSVDDIVVRANRTAYYQGADGRATVTCCPTGTCSLR